MTNKNKKTFLKNFLTTASAFAVIVGASADAMGAAARKTSANPAATAVFSTGGGFTGGGEAFVTGSTLEFAAAKDVDVDSAGVNILAVDVHGQDLTGGGKYFNISEDASIGSIVDLGAAGNALALPAAENQAQIKYIAVKTLTLDGRISDAVGFFAAASNAPVDNYSALGVIDFNDQIAPTLSINANSGNAITLNNASIVGGDGKGAILDVQTNLIVKDASFATIDEIQLTAAKSLTIDAGKNNISTTATSVYTFGDGDSTLAYNVDLEGGAKTIDFLNHLNHVVDQVGPADEDFTISFGAIDATSSGKALTIDATGGGKTIGTNNANRAKELTLIGTENITFSANIGVFAKNIKQAGTGETTFTNVIDSGLASTLNFTAAGKIKFNGAGNNNIITADFTGNNGTITLADGANYKGAINSTVASAGKLVVEGDTTVTGAVGATKALNLVKLDGANGKTGIFTAQVKTNELNLSAGADAQFNGGAVIAKLTMGHDDSHVKIADAMIVEFTGAENVTFKGGADDIVFDGNDSQLKFNAVDGKQLVVNITNAALNTGANGRGIITLHADGDDAALAPVDSSMKITGSALGGASTLKEVAITGDKIVKVQNAGINTALLSIAAGSTLEYTPTANVSFNNVTFADAVSTLKLEANAAARTFTMNAHINPGGNGQGIVELASNGNSATLDGNGGVKTLGTGGNNIAVLNVTGANTGIITGNVDLTNVNELNIKNGASLQSKTNTTAAIAAINIGEVGGKGTLEIDANAGNYDLLNGKLITLTHADSLLKLTNIAAANRVVTLHANVVPGAGADLTGSLEINSNGTHKLDLAINAAEIIGTDKTHRLKELIVSGNKNTQIDAEIFAKTITISSTADVIFGEEIDSGAASIINVTGGGAGTIITAKDNITATTLNLNNQARIILANDGVDLDFNTISNGGNTTLNLAGTNTLNLQGVKTVNLARINAVAVGGAKVVTLAAGTYNVAEIQLADNAGNSFLDLEDNFELTGAINLTAGSAAGNIRFLGNGKVTGDLGSAGNAVGVVTVDGVGKTLQLGGNVNATSLNATVGNAQNLKFINAAARIVAGKVGNLQPFDQIEFSGGGKLTFGAGNLTTGQALYFSADTEVVTNNYDLGATNVTNAAGINGNKLTVNANQAITGNIGKGAQKFGELHVDVAALANRDVSIDAATFFAGVTGAKANVIFNAAGSSVSYLGEAGTNINNADFVQDGIVLGAVHAETIDVRAGRTATFNDVVFDSTGMKMHDNDARADFAAKVALDAPITANAASDGIINFNDGVVLNQSVGADGTRVNSATIAGDSTISNDLHADVITVGAYELTLTRDAIFNGVTGFTDTTLNLAEHDLTMKGGNVIFTGASTIKTTVAAANLGNLVAGDGSTIILEGANTLTVEVDDAAALPVDGQNLKLIAKAGNGILEGDPSKVTVTATGAFSKWTPKVINGEFVLTQVSQIQEVISAAIEEAGLSDVISEDVAQAIEDYEKGTAGEDFALQLHQMTKPNIADATARLTNTTSNEVSEVNLELLNEITNIISSRVSDMGNLLGSSFNPTATNATKSTKVSSENNYISGVAAGDENDRFGVWATPFYSKSTQKKRSGTFGFKADSYGGTFGADTRVNDNMILGAAFTAMNTDIKHKGLKSGDKTKVSTYLLSIYGLHQFTNNWFGQGVVSIGSSSVNNKENKRISNTQLVIAEGKYSSMTFATEVLAGYNHMVNDQLVVTPMFGLNYNRINDGSYNESGAAAGPQLMQVTKKASQKLDIVGGVKVETKPIILNGIAITPEVHAFVRHDVIGKGAKVNAKISGLSLLPGEKAKLQKTFYEVGTSLDASYGSMDYGISADATFAKKYVGVQGALKLRVNF